ncbi:MAG: hypothetical protein ACRD0H_19015, partial [Actinomycetes bacterium]
LGVQAQSIQGLTPHAGLLGRAVTTAFAGTFLVNLALHVQGTMTAIGTGDWFGVAVNGTFALADALFLVQALPAMIAGWVGYDPTLYPWIRATVQALALPVITVANFLFSLQLAFVDPSLLVVPAVALTLASGYLSWLGIAAELGLGRIETRKGVYANLVLAASLLTIGLAEVVPASGWGLVLGVAAAAGIAMLGLSFIDGWRAANRRGPPDPDDGGPPTGPGPAPTSGPPFAPPGSTPRRTQLARVPRIMIARFAPRSPLAALSARP